MSAIETPADDAVLLAARRLQQAAATSTPCAPVRDVLGAQDVALAYAVQRELTADSVRNGRRRVGRKIGLTAAVVQQQLGVDQPDFGVLFDDMQFDTGATVPMARLIQPRIEAEIAFVLGADLDQPDISADDVLAATEYVIPAFEIVDSRISGWDISIVDTVADNASSGLFVLGQPRHPISDRDLRAVTMTVSRNGTVVSSGRGDACLGDPAVACAWLANTAVALGDPLRAGEIVLSGALGPMVDISASDRFDADFGEFGSVSARFSDQGAG